MPLRKLNASRPAVPETPPAPAVPPFEWYPVAMLPPIAKYAQLGGGDNIDRPLITADVLLFVKLARQPPEYSDGKRIPPSGPPEVDFFIVSARYNFAIKKWAFMGRASLEYDSGWTLTPLFWSTLPPMPPIFDVPPPAEAYDPAAPLAPADEAEEDQA
jgi:hypothetical protein